MVESIEYRYRGSIERWNRRAYRWVDGYSADGDSGGRLYPWMTKKECRRDAKAQGKRATFT